MTIYHDNALPDVLDRHISHKTILVVAGCFLGLFVRVCKPATRARMRLDPGNPGYGGAGVEPEGSRF